MPNPILEYVKGDILFDNNPVETRLEKATWWADHVSRAVNDLEDDGVFPSFRDMIQATEVLTRYVAVLTDKEVSNG